MNRFILLELIKLSRDPVRNYDRVHEFMHDIESRSKREDGIGKVIPPISHEMWAAYGKMQRNIYKFIKKRPHMISGRFAFYIRSPNEINATSHSRNLRVTPNVAKDIAEVISRGPINFNSHNMSLSYIMKNPQYEKIKMMISDGEVLDAAETLMHMEIRRSSHRPLEDYTHRERLELTRGYLRRTESNKKLRRELYTRIQVMWYNRGLTMVKEMDRRVEREREGTRKQAAMMNWTTEETNRRLSSRASNIRTQARNVLANATMRLYESGCITNWLPMYMVNPVSENSAMFNDYAKYMKEDGWCEYRMMCSSGGTRRNDGMKYGARLARQIYCKFVESRMVIPPDKKTQKIREVRWLETKENYFTYPEEEV